MTEQQRTIGVFFGGKSLEHDVSIVSGLAVLRGLISQGRPVVPVYIGKDGRWFSSSALTSLEFFSKPGLASRLKKFPAVSVELSAGPQLILRTQEFFSKEMHIDVAFPVLHGQNGEDGSLQGLFELAGIPYVGSGVTASAVAMDKVLTKERFKTLGIDTPDFIYFSKRDWKTYGKEVRAQAQSLGFPVFVKPARAGSSIGISCVRTPEDFEFNVDVAFHYDSKVVIEKGVPDALDLTVAVLGNETLRTSLIQETEYDGAFLDFKAKYGQRAGEGNSKETGRTAAVHVPARIDEEVRSMVEEEAKYIYSSFECKGMARIDFLYDPKRRHLYANEINTLPGALALDLWRKTGTSFSEILDTLILLALRSENDKKSQIATFDSSILENIPKGKMEGALDE